MGHWLLKTVHNIVDESASYLSRIIITQRQRGDEFVVALGRLDIRRMLVASMLSSILFFSEMPWISQDKIQVIP